MITQETDLKLLRRCIELSVTARTSGNTPFAALNRTYSIGTRKR